MTNKSPQKNEDDWLKPKQFADRSHVWRRRSRSERGAEDLLRAWYGDNMGGFEIERHQGREKHVSDLVDAMLQDWNMDDRVVLRNLMEKWDEIIGAEFKKYTIPGLLEDKVLSIEVFNTVIIMKLRNVQAQLLARIKEFAGDEVEEIRFIPGGRSSRRPRK